MIELAIVSIMGEPPPMQRNADAENTAAVGNTDRRYTSAASVWIVSKGRLGRLTDQMCTSKMQGKSQQG